jgi:D-methionine transport system substrate-binding protein
VARPEDVTNKTYLRIVELYHNPEVLKSVVESSGGTAVIVKGYDGAALRQILTDTQANLKAVG